MGRRLQLQVPRARGKWLRNMERRVVHICTGLNTPRPQTSTPHYRHLFEREREGGLPTNGIHLNLSFGLSNQPGPPQCRVTEYHTPRDDPLTGVTYSHSLSRCSL